MTLDLDEGSVWDVGGNLFPTPLAKVLETVQEQELFVQCPTSVSLTINDGIGWHKSGGVALCLSVEQKAPTGGGVGWIG